MSKKRKRKRKRRKKNCQSHSYKIPSLKKCSALKSEMWQLVPLTLRTPTLHQGEILVNSNKISVSRLMMRDSKPSKTRCGCRTIIMRCKVLLQGSTCSTQSGVLSLRVGDPLRRRKTGRSPYRMVPPCSINISKGSSKQSNSKHSR